MTQRREEIIQTMFEKGILLNKELLDVDEPIPLLEDIHAEADLLVLNHDYAEATTRHAGLVDWYEIDRLRVEAEKDRDDSLYQHHIQRFKRSTLRLTGHENTPEQQLSSLEVEVGDAKTTFLTNTITAPLSLGEEKVSFSSPSVTITISHNNIPHKYTPQDFTNLFISRYKFIEGILRHRRELQNLLSINRVTTKNERDTVSIIGIVNDIATTKNGNILLTLEDMTSKIKVLVQKNKQELFKDGRDIIFDEVIGVKGTVGSNILFADALVWPDVPPLQELKKSEAEEYALFLSDTHVGSTLFLRAEFEKFLQWINGNLGDTSYQTIAHNVKYIFIAGDLVDGVGVYPSQETELEIKDVREQYSELARLLRRIPSDKHIILCPGNHDIIHLAEPQPILYQSYAAELFTFPNITMVTNPGVITIGRTPTFAGFDVLMYHGYSFDYYVANVESIRNSGGYHRADLIMRYLLKRRHLAPSFKSTPYFPGHTEDPLLIRTVPDFFVTGHIHYAKMANYRGVTMISGSCWQACTSFQLKLGHDPEPGRVPLVNLKTREMKILRFT